MLIHNIYTDEGLVNGAQGSVTGVEWGDDNNTMPRGVYVTFDNPAIGRSLRNPPDHEYREAILIRPISMENSMCTGPAHKSLLLRALTEMSRLHAAHTS